MARYVQSGSLTNAFVAFFTIPNTPSLLVSNFHLTTSAASNVSICIAPIGTPASASNAILWTYAVGNDLILDIFSGGIMGPNDVCWGLSTGACAWRVSGDLT